MSSRFFVFAAAVVVASASGAPAEKESVDSWFDSHYQDLSQLYVHLHTHPELSFKEHETAKRIAEELRKAGAVVTTGVGKLGVVGVLANGEGPKVLFRTDLDALPVTEQTGLAYASKATTADDEGHKVGVMHACGHDVHMTNLVATARWLADHKDQWRGTVIFIGQPAEEKIGGARRRCSRTGSTSDFPSPITPWPCTWPTTWRPARWAFIRAPRWPAPPRWT